ncbi:hypothetical protein [Acinetobacter sp. CE-15]|uniref:hypothetical protein n=1 Tax=unclassified Acinetobacter TaxID=196816 RepID=UPI003DA38B69
MLANSFFSKTFLYLYAFLYIFNPGNFFSFNLMYLLGVFAIGYFFINISQTLIYLSSKRVLIFISICLLFFMYLFVLYLFGADDALLRGYSFLLIILSLLCALTILSIYSKIYSCNFKDFCDFIIKVGAIQLFFVILALTVPAFRDWTLATARQNSIQDISNDFGSGLRSFGLATGYTSTFPMLMGLCSLLSIYYFIFSKKISEKITYLFLFLGMILSVILNARIGLVPIALWLIVSPLYLLYKRKVKLFILLVLMFSLGFIFIGIDYLQTDYFFRLMQGVEELKKLSEGKSTGTFETLSYMWFFPEDIMHFLWGEGKIIVGAYPVGSDIGLIQDIFMFGLVPTVFLGFILLYFLNPLFKNISKTFGTFFFLIFICSLFLYYLKGMNFYSNEVSNTVLLLAVFSIFTYNDMKSVK